MIRLILKLLRLDGAKVINRVAGKFDKMVAKLDKGMARLSAEYDKNLQKIAKLDVKNADITRAEKMGKKLRERLSELTQ